ncbi:MAG: hypothetical protein Q8R04_07085 [Nanoarchaeota archaeon]|nr:hypothetical protein [Nanoarchaeota archaeon]
MHGKKLKYWQKGAIFGLLFGLFSLLMVIGTALSSGYSDFVLEFIGELFDKIPISGEPGWVLPLGICLFFIFYGLIGALIGLAIGKIKKFL